MLSNDPHCGHLRRLLIFALSLIRRNRFLLIYTKLNKSTNYKDITNQKWQLYPLSVATILQQSWKKEKPTTLM